MTTHEARLKKAYAASGLSFLRISFQQACNNSLLRMGLEGWVRAQNKKAKTAPIQPSLI